MTLMPEYTTYSGGLGGWPLPTMADGDALQVTRTKAFSEVGGQKTLEKRLRQSLFRCFHKTRKAGSPTWVFQPLQTQELLEFDFRASFLELFLGSFRIGLWSAFLDVLRRTVHQVLGFLEAQAGEFANRLDDLNLVRANFLQHDLS